MREGTRYNYRKHLDLLKARLGGGILVDLDQEAVEVYTAQIAREHGDSAGDDQIAMISNLWQYAKNFRRVQAQGTASTRPIASKRHYKHDGEGHLVWPDEVIEAFDTGCPWHLKFVRMGLHYTGQRGGDVVKMKWTDFDGKRIYVVQEKTGKKLWLNCPKPLLDVLLREQKRTNREYIFHHAYDAPFANAQTLSHAIRNRLEALGINRDRARRQRLHHARAAQERRHGIGRGRGRGAGNHGGARAQNVEDGDVLLRAGAAGPHERKRGGEVGCRARKEGDQEAQNPARGGVNKGRNFSQFC